MWELAIATRFPVVARRTYPIGVIPADPPGARNALSLTLSIGGAPVEVIGLHTSSKVWKLAPVRHLMALRRQLPNGGPQILAGDFNFWGPPVGMLMRGWQRPVRGRTYPAPRPHSQIDHILVRGGIRVLDGEVLGETPSDHRPVRARLSYGDGVS
jgi:endonuclease/exonuclease/phosphatase (EEP) superfamily protein YafD